jgi:hypothetical protein
VNAGNVARVARLNYYLGGVAIMIAALTQARATALGVVVGVVLTILNFELLKRLIFRWTSDAAEGRSTTGSGMLLIPKMMGLMGAVVLALWLLPISGVGLAIGYSIFVISIFVEIIMSAFSPREQKHG